MTSPEQIQTRRRDAALSTGRRTALRYAVTAESAPFNCGHLPANTVFSSALSEDFDRIRRPVKQESQAKPREIGFVSQKHINSETREPERTASEVFPPQLFAGEVALRSPRGEAGTKGVMR